MFPIAKVATADFEQPHRRCAPIEIAPRRRNEAREQGRAHADGIYPVRLRCRRGPCELGPRGPGAEAGRALARNEGVGRNRLSVFLDGQHPSGRRCRPIRALEARTYRAGGSHGGRRRIRQVQPIGISDARCIFDVATKPDGEKRIVAQVRTDRALDRPAEGEKALTLRRFDELSDGLAGGLEGGVKVPARACDSEW